MPWPNCDICGEQAMGVAACSLAPISFAYCKTCLMDGAEVPSVVAMTIADCGGRDKVHPYVLELIEPSLRRARLTDKAFEDMIADFSRMADTDAEHHSGPDGGEKVRQVRVDGEAGPSPQGL